MGFIRFPLLLAPPFGAIEKERARLMKEAASLFFVFCENFGRKLVFSAVLCYDGAGDENG